MKKLTPNPHASKLAGLRAILRANADAVADAIEALAGVTRDAADDFSTVNLPGDVRTPRTFNEWCRSGDVKGAEKIGRVWHCSRAAWFAARSKRVALHVVPVAEPTDAELAEQALAASGMRNARHAS